MRVYVVRELVQVQNGVAVLAFVLQSAACDGRGAVQRNRSAWLESVSHVVSPALA